MKRKRSIDKKDLYDLILAVNNQMFEEVCEMSRTDKRDEQRLIYIGGWMDALSELEYKAFLKMHDEIR